MCVILFVGFLKSWDNILITGVAAVLITLLYSVLTYFAILDHISKNKSTNNDNNSIRNDNSKNDDSIDIDKENN